MGQDFFTHMPPGVLEQLASLQFELDHPRADKAMRELLNRTVLMGGKRLRPLLTYLMGHFFKLPLADLDVLARSVEQVHAASLAHDDVIDNATTRRNAPSINILGSNKKAVLAGDYLLADVIVNLAKLENPNLVAEMARVIQELAHGEWIQWDAVLERSIDEDRLEKIARFKTASVMSWCAVAPAMLAKLDPKIIQTAKVFAEHLGLCFQLMDDTLDHSENSQKDQNLDLQNEQINSVLYAWMQAHPEKWQAYQQGEPLASLTAGGDFSAAREKVQAQASEHLNAARAGLESLKTLYPSYEKAAVPALEVIMSYLEERKF